ncbi:MAG TPA: DinB family protein, partial [Blastocatellia bacterium]|nr:DinB family protein [Blastocatellia bacterium]
FRNRYVTMLSENQPYLARVDQDQLAAEGNYIDQDGAAAFAEFERVRQETVTILRSAEAERWLRIGSHWNGGQITVHDLAVRQCEHDMNHLAQVKDIVRLRMPW